MRLSVVLAALLLVGATAEVKAQFGPQRDMDTKYATELIQPGSVAPDFKMQTIDGKKFQFSKFAKGKTVVLDFWASWCPDCRKDAPEVSVCRWIPMWRLGRKLSSSSVSPIRR